MGSPVLNDWEGYALENGLWLKERLGVPPLDSATLEA
jgi:hypothetical protein